MFSDISFRQKLLEAKSEEEFKQELVCQRQQLSIAGEKQVEEEVDNSDPRKGKALQVRERSDVSAPFDRREVKMLCSFRDNGAAPPKKKSRSFKVNISQNRKQTNIYVLHWLPHMCRPPRRLPAPSRRIKTRCSKEKSSRARLSDYPVSTLCRPGLRKEKQLGNRLRPLPGLPWIWQQNVRGAV